jgi:glycosyltransferase involved in cell wall biosynthesis
MTDAARNLFAAATAVRNVLLPVGTVTLPLVNRALRVEGPLPAGAERRILIVAPQPMYEDRGTPIAVLSVLRALSQLDYEVDLVTYPIGRPIEIPGVRVIRSPNPFGIRHVPVGFSLRKLLLDLTLIPTMWMQLRRQRYACMHAVEEAAFPAAILGPWYRTPVIYDMQSSLPEQMVSHRGFRSRLAQSFLRACESWLLRRVALVVSSAGLLRRVAEVAPGTPASEWHFPTESSAPASSATERLRRELGIAPSAPVVLYAGTFEPYQGLPLLLDAVQVVRDRFPDAVFVLVGGSGESAEVVAREVLRRRLSGGVRLLGRKPREQMPDYLAMADVLVSPRSYGDNLPLKVFDYLASGRPIVATDMPAHRSVLDDTRAVLTEPSAAGLALGISRVLTQPEDSARLAAAGRAYSASHLGWPRFVDAVDSVYEQAIPPVPVPRLVNPATSCVA